MKLVASSLYPKPSIKSNSTIVSWNKSDTCKNLLITDSKFRCHKSLRKISARQD